MSRLAGITKEIVLVGINIAGYGKDLKPKRVAGCPPDAFTPLGQLWGNPLYDYNKMAQNGYEWWINRIKSALVLYDVIRMISETPSKIMNVYNRKGSLQRGKDADILIIDKNYEVRGVIAMGKTIKSFV